MGLQSIDGVFLGRILKGALQWLSQHRQEIDALNVFPVPDGDTGSNMQATLEAAVAAVEETPPRSIAMVADAAAKGALMGARGNSGVILSQIIQGFATALRGKAEAGVQDIAEALAAGTEYAYRAVGEPVEGTILTVVREAAQEARNTAHRSQNLLRLLTYVLKAATRSLAQTPELLPILKEAGVVDAGGRGFTAILEGVFQTATETRSKTGLSPSPTIHEEATNRGTELGIPPPFPVDDLNTINFTYCTEFLLKGTALKTVEIKEALAPHGDCLMVVGEGEILRIHIHSDHPGAVLEEGLKYGTLHNIRINNMRDQHRELNRPKTSVAVVAVCVGEGFETLFTNLGAFVVLGGQTMNPSTGEIAAAVDGTGSREVIILPNNPNIILTAQQVKSLTAKGVHVVPTESMPQGLSALLAFNQEEDAFTNSSRMKAASAKVVTTEITRAVRDAKIGGTEIKGGDIIALAADELISSGDDLVEVTLAAFQKVAAGKDLVTLYYGKEVDPEVAQETADRLSEVMPDVELELQYGGQPHYFFLIAAE